MFAFRLVSRPLQQALLLRVLATPLLVLYVLLSTRMRPTCFVRLAPAAVIMRLLLLGLEGREVGCLAAGSS